MTLRDTDELYSPVIFRRGDPTLPGRTVPRRFLEVIAGENSPAFPNGSGRHDLAQAITSPRNPLTARVFVNRTWMHHFGEPLVDILSGVCDFLDATPGARALWPVHPNPHVREAIDRMDDWGPAWTARAETHEAMGMDQMRGNGSRDCSKKVARVESLTL